MTEISRLIRTTGAVFAAGMLAACLTVPAHAQETKSTMEGLKLSNDQPIQIESDKLEIIEQDSKAEFTGNVNVVQGTTMLKAGHMTVFYKKKGDAAPEAKAGAAMSSGNADIDKIDLTDKVFLSSGTQTATADTGHFDMASQTFVLEGQQVVLSEGPNVFTGCKLTVLMDTGQATLDGCNKRVKVMIDPKSQKK